MSRFAWFVIIMLGSTFLFVLVSNLRRRRKRLRAEAEIKAEEQRKAEEAARKEAEPKPPPRFEMEFGDPDDLGDALRLYHEAQSQAQGAAGNAKGAKKIAVELLRRLGNQYISVTKFTHDQGKTLVEREKGLLRYNEKNTWAGPSLMAEAGGLEYFRLTPDSRVEVASQLAPEPVFLPVAELNEALAKWRLAEDVSSGRKERLSAAIASLVGELSSRIGKYCRFSSADRVKFYYFDWTDQWRKEKREYYKTQNDPLIARVLKLVPKKDQELPRLKVQTLYNGNIWDLDLDSITMIEPVVELTANLPEMATT